MAGRIEATTVIAAEDEVPANESKSYDSIAADWSESDRKTQNESRCVQTSTAVPMLMM